MSEFLKTLFLVFLVFLEFFACRLSSANNEQLSLRLEKASELTSYMNLSADPCENFYNFACGNWEKQHSDILHKNRVTTVEDVLEAKVNKDLQHLLEEPQRPSDSANVIKVKDFFNSCTSASSSSSSQHNFLVNFIKRNGGLPLVSGTNWHNNYNWLYTIAKLRADYGIEVLIGLEIEINPQTFMGQKIFFTEPKTSILPVDLCSKVAANQANYHERDYEVFQNEISRNLQKWISLKPADAHRLAGDVIAFEFKLCKHMRKDQSLSTNLEMGDIHHDNPQYRGGGGFNGPSPFRVGQNRLHGTRQANGDWYLTLNQLNEHFSNKIDFKNFTETVFNTTISDHVYLKSESYFSNLGRLIHIQSKNTLANYIIYKALTAFNFPIDDRRNKRAHYCVELVKTYFSQVAGEMFSSKFREDEILEELNTLLAKLKNSFANNLNNEFFRENLKRTIKQELFDIGISQTGRKSMDLSFLNLRGLDFWQKLEHLMRVNANEFLEKLYLRPPETLEAFKTNLKSAPRQIFIGYGVMQPPFYHKFFSNSLKYSVIGHRIAKELVKQVDEPFWNESPPNVARRDEYTKESYRARADCFRQQFSNYLHNSPNVFQNASMLRDVMEQIAGLKIAFNAYLDWLESVQPTSIGFLKKETLTDVNFSNTQLFFINFAQSYCFGIKNPKPVPSFTPYESHSKEMFMVNGAVGNFDEFSREFGCAPGSDMNIDDKCVIY